MISDKVPLVHASLREDGGASIYEMFSNQLCLLPCRSRQAGSIAAIDKITMCISEVFDRYHTRFNQLSSPFAEDIATKYSKLENKRKELQKELKTIVEKCSSRDGFRHMLTELVLTKLRCNARKDHEIVPIDPL